MPRYNIQKRQRLDRITAKHNNKMRKVIRADLNKRVRDVFDQLNAERRSYEGDTKVVKPKSETVFENHEFDTVRSSLSDGIQEVTPDMELGLWRLVPEHSCPIISLDEIRPTLGKKRDELTEETIKKVRKNKKFSIADLNRLLLADYLSIIKGGYRSVAKDWIAGESTQREVLDMLSAVFRKNDNDTMKIFRTETTNYFNESRADYFITETGMDFMQIFTLADGRRSEICETRHGWVFEIALSTARKRMPSFHPYCYSDDTEVYTNKGWQFFKDVDVGQNALSMDPDTKNLEWIPIIDKQSRMYQGEMLHFKNPQGSLDLKVTPDHTMFYYKPRKYGFEPVFNSIETFLKNTDSNWLYVSSEWVGSKIQTVDVCGLSMRAKDFCRFMGFYLSDGSTRKGSTNLRYPQIAQSKGQDVMFKEMIKFGFKNTTKTKGKINVYDSRVGEYCRQFGRSPDKFVPEVIKSMSSDLIRDFLDAFNQCDGSISKPKSFKGANFNPFKVYFTTSKRMADDLTELLVKVGKSASVRISKISGKKHEFRNGIYTINHDLIIISELNSKHRKAKIVKRIPYTGMVYDLSLEKFHTLLVRRNGRMVWGSNCRTIQRPLTTRLASHQRLIDIGLAMNEAQFAPLPKGWA